MAVAIFAVGVMLMIGLGLQLGNIRDELKRIADILEDHPNAE